MCLWVFKKVTQPKEQILFAFEHTGLYAYQLAQFLEQEELSFSIIPGLAIKRSLGISRGKDDKIDASKIAKYAYRLRDEIELTILPTKDLEVLKETPYN